jgi:dTDP-4-amino-4,6-dideoxygalactose transaminase
MRLAIDGGSPAIPNRLRPFNTIGPEEISMATASMRAGPLSGYLGGELHGGLRCEALEYEFAGLMGAKHAVAVNSATSGLLAACAAVGVTRGSEVRTTPFTMSATAAAPAFLGADLVFNDIESKHYNMDGTISTKTKAVVLANIFGHPAELARWADQVRGGRNCWLIEDNAQSPFAMEDNKYAGTVGDIGVFSLNVHKHLQCGEGGICVTNNATLADRMRLFRNHSELSDTPIIGLNLRMTETTAAIALAQLTKREQIIAGRIALAEELTHLAKGIPFVKPPSVREGCKHVYYLWALEVQRDRDWFVKALRAEGLPIKAGYVTPLYKLPAFERFRRKATFPVTEEVNDKIVLFEICAHDPSSKQRRQIKEAFDKVGEGMTLRQQLQRAI